MRHLLLAALASGISDIRKVAGLAPELVQGLLPGIQPNGTLPYRPSAKMPDSALGTTVPSPAKSDIGPVPAIS